MAYRLPMDLVESSLVFGFEVRSAKMRLKKETLILFEKVWSLDRGTQMRHELVEFPLKFW